MADVIALLLCVADVIPTMYTCYNCYVADVIAEVADGIAYQGGLEVLEDVIAMSGRWSSHWGQFLF